MASQLRARHQIDPTVASLMESGFRIGASRRASREEAEAARVEQEARLEQIRVQQAAETRRQLLVKAEEYRQKSAETAAKNTWDFNKDSWNTGIKQYFAGLDSAGGYQPAEWLKPENAWKLTPESRAKAQAYQLNADARKQQVMRVAPQDFSTFHDPALYTLQDGTSLTAPVGMWQPEFSADYRAELVKKGIIKDGSGGGGDDEKEKKKQTEQFYKDFVKSRGDFMESYGKWHHVASGKLNPLWNKYKDAADWKVAARAEGNVTGEDGKDVYLVDDLLRSEEKTNTEASGKLNQFLTYMRDPNYVSSYIRTAKPSLTNADAIAARTSSFIDEYVSDFNNLRGARDLTVFRDWLRAGRRGEKTYKKEDGTEISTADLTNSDVKAGAGVTYELLFNEPLFK